MDFIKKRNPEQQISTSIIAERQQAKASSLADQKNQIDQRIIQQKQQQQQQQQTTDSKQAEFSQQSFKDSSNESLLPQTSNLNKTQEAISRSQLNDQQQINNASNRNPVESQHQPPTSLDESLGLIDKSSSSCCLARFCCCCLFSGWSKRNSREMAKLDARAIPAFFVAELMGTFLLVAIGDGAISAYVLSGRQVDLFAVCMAFGVGAMVATFTAAKISGAHVNPAASLAMALDGQLSWRLLPIYMLAQYLGGFLAALVLMLNNYEAITELDGGRRSTIGSSNSTGFIFATYPGSSQLSAWGVLMDQIVGTSVLLFALSALSDKKNANLDAKFQPIAVSLTVGLICVAFSPNCGAIFNPARDLAPRLLSALFGYPNVWAPVGGLYWLLAGVVGPHLGAIVGVFAYKLLIGTSLSAIQEIGNEDGELYSKDLTENIADSSRRLHQQQRLALSQQQQQQQQQSALGTERARYGAAAARG